MLTWGKWGNFKYFFEITKTCQTVEARRKRPGKPEGLTPVLSGK